MQAAGRFVLRAIQAIRILATDGRIPRPLRWLAVGGLLPIPGPFDEAILLVVAAPLFLFYRPLLREAWHEAASRRSPEQVPEPHAPVPVPRAGPFPPRG